MSYTPEEILQASKTAFVDLNVNSNLAIRPKFISNDYKSGSKVLSSIEGEVWNKEVAVSKKKTA